MKKTLTALGIGAVAIAVNSVDASALQKGVVTASALNIRSNPSTTSKKVGLAYKGSSVEILEKSSGGWYKVKVSSTVVGWASAQYISLDSSSGSTNNSESTAQSGNGKVAVGSRLNVRSGPGTNNGIVGSANNGEVLQLLELSNGWYKVKLSNGTVGWVSSQYIVKTSDSVGSGSNSGDNSESTAQSGNGKVVVGSRLNVRSGPGTNNGIVGSANNGEVLQLLELSNGWYKVKLANGTVGWVSSQYIVKTSDSVGSGSNSSDSGESTAQSGNGKVAVGSRLNVRSGPGTNYGIVGSANNGEVLQLLELSNGWYKVKLANGTVGWAISQYIVKTSESVGSDSNSGDKGNSGSTSVQGKKGKIRSGISLNVRSGAGTSYSVVGKLNGGDVVQLLELKNGWYKIQLLNGSTGWVSGDYVSETNDALYESGSTGSGSNNNNNSNGNTGGSSNEQTPSYGNGAKVVDFAYTLIGIPYQWGANGPNSFDCSGFTKYVYEKSVGKSIPRVSSSQAAYGSPVSMGNYVQGDLVYFDTTGDGATNHVGIYVGNGKFIHCSGTQANPNKVKVDSLTGSYWSKALLGARRII